VKTISLKKVAVVAVASLGFGLLSVVPTNAANTSTFVNSVTLAKVTATPTVGSAVAVNFQANTDDIANQADGSDFTAEFTGFLSSYPAGGFTTVGVSETAPSTDVEISAVAAAAAGVSVTEAASGATYTVSITGAATQASNDFTGNTTVASSTSGAAQFSFTPSKAGVHILTVWNDADADGVVDVVEAVQTISITVVAAATYSNTLSTAFISYGMLANGNVIAPTSTTTAAPINQPATKGGLDATDDQAAAIDVVLNNTSNGSYTSGASLSAEISGPGYLVWANEAVDVGNCFVSPQYGANIGRSLAARAVDAQSALYVCADGTSGVGTVTLKITDADDAVYTLATRTVTFFGAVSKIVATGVLTNARVAGASATGTAVADRDLSSEVPSVIVFATDKNGVGVTGLTVSAKSSDVTVMNSSLPTIAEDVKSSANVFSSGGAGYYNIQTQAASSAVSGGKATMTFRVVDPAGDGTTYLTSDVAFTIGGSVSTETISFDKTAYAPGEAMVITLTAKDSSGNPVYDGAASPSVTFSKAVGGTTPGTSTYAGGKKATSATAPTVFAPVIAGSFSALATSGATGGPAITAASSVTDANAGLLTQIDALNAKIVALNALIAKIMKKLGVK